MGKYMKKSKITGDVAVMEVSQSSMGVRTRAKTLALQRLQSTLTPPQKLDNSSYLQLRSRRLEKPPPLLLNETTNATKRLPKDSCRENPNPKPSPNPRVSSRLRLSSVNKGSVGSVSLSCSKNEDEYCGTTTATVGREGEKEEFNDVGVEASFGENNLEFEGRERSTRESTPCSLIRDSDAIGTPRSTTRPTSSTATNWRVRNAVQKNIPTTREMEEFFACAEQQQQRLFTEKYNFDIVSDLPLPGRYEWVKVNP
ncbi:hypothetical protein L1049_005351 [Liquidambar formosana]|uniref:Cyclin-dependent kinase inhibitor domain-containing protein n=1 Tax=Liquidambar formosana TaxID=63359 RepID=A0AAP0RPT1_LIQFO